MEGKDRDSTVNRGSVSAFLSATGALVTGAFGILGCYLAIIYEKEYTGGGILLLASALAFGLLANATFRH